MIAKIKGRNALITGAADSIGKECARKLAESGANIVVADLNVEAGQEVANELMKDYGVKSIAAKCDLYDWESTQAMCREAIKKMDKIDILICSGGAGGKWAKFLHEFNPAVDFEGVIRARLFNRLYPIYGLFEHMKENRYGKIVVITSDSGRTATIREGFIGACASGLITLGKVMAREWGRYGIRVNTLCLTVIKDTAALRNVMNSEAAHVFKKVFERAVLGVPEAVDVAEAALYFSSPESDKISGSVFSINGGLSFPG